MNLPPVRPEIAAMQPYTPILPYEVRAAQLGLPMDRLVKLDANENPYGPAPAVHQALADLAHLHIYPDPESRRLRQALATFHNLPAERLLVGAGADELIDLTLRLLLQPGDRILICPPTFGMYAFSTAINGGQVISVPRRADFSLDLPAIQRAVARHRPKVLFLATPNNPDGSLPDEETLAALLALPLYLVLDEAYIEFAPAGSSRLPLALTRENLIILRTFSKWGGLAGLRVGYGIFPAALLPHLWKIKPPYNLNVAAEAAALASLRAADWLNEKRDRIVAERKRLYEHLQAIPGLQPYPSQGNFILCRLSGPSAADIHQRLMRQGILVRYFNKPGLRDCIRISVGRPEENDRLLQALQSITGRG